MKDFNRKRNGELCRGERFRLVSERRGVPRRIIDKMLVFMSDLVDIGAFALNFLVERAVKALFGKFATFVVGITLTGTLTLMVILS